MIFDQAEKTPPFVCRLAARKLSGWLPMSMADLARASKLSKGYVAKLSYLNSWKGIPIDVVERFSKACGVDLMNSHKTIEFLRKSKMVYMKNCSQTQKRFFARLLKVRKPVKPEHSPASPEFIEFVSKLLNVPKPAEPEHPPASKDPKLFMLYGK